MNFERVQSGVYYSASSESPPSYGNGSFPYHSGFPENEDWTFGTGTGIPAPKQTNRRIIRKNLPLLEVSVDANVVSTTESTTITQVFSNPTDEPIKEAAYVFPLYDGSTVVSFCARIQPDIIIKGVIKPKAEAHKQYDHAISQQKVATLLDEHSPEIFETRLENNPSDGFGQNRHSLH